MNTRNNKKDGSELKKLKNDCGMKEHQKREKRRRKRRREGKKSGEDVSVHGVDENKREMV